MESFQKRGHTVIAFATCNEEMETAQMNGKLGQTVWNDSTVKGQEAWERQLESSETESYFVAGAGLEPYS